MSSYRPHPRWAPWAFIAPFVILFAVFTAWPLLRSLQLAFEQTYGPQTTVFVGLKNFRYLLTDPLFWRAVTNTVEFTVWTVGLQVPIALGLALLLNRPNLRGRAVLRLIFFSPSLVGLVFVAMLFMPIFEKRTGLLNVWLHALWPAWNLEFPWFDSYEPLTQDTAERKRLQANPSQDSYNSGLRQHRLATSVYPHQFDEPPRQNPR